MAARPAAAARDVSVGLGAPVAISTVLADYWALTKPEVNFLILITTAAGFYLGARTELVRFPWMVLGQALAGTLLVASGAGVLNHWREYPFDARMRRTARRPIPSGRIHPDQALAFGLILSVAGISYLAYSVGTLASLLALGALVAYLFLYTPLKRTTALCTAVGAVPGAVPPLIGWAAARGHLNTEAWLLFWIVFLWQFPHFTSIAWIYRDDYQRAGFVVLPATAKDSFVTVQTLLPLLMLLFLSVLLVPGSHRAPYSIGALLLGMGFLHFGMRFTSERSRPAARRLLMASILYLPALLTLMVLMA